MPKNRKRGHKIKKINGVRGVAIPGDGGPWKLRHINDNMVDLEEEEDIGTGSEVDSEVVDAKYQDTL